MTPKKKMNVYKIRMNCSSFHDVVVEAENKEEAIRKASNIAVCPQHGMEFGEFLEVEEGDEPEN